MGSLLREKDENFALIWETDSEGFRLRGNDGQDLCIGMLMRKPWPYPGSTAPKHLYQPLLVLKALSHLRHWSRGPRPWPSSLRCLWHGH